MEINQPNSAKVVSHNHSGLFWCLIIATGLIFTILSSFIPYLWKTEYQIGDIAKKNIIADKTVTIIDKVKTHSLRDAARQKVIPVFKTNKDNDTISRTKLSKRIKDIETLQANNIKPWPDKLNLNGFKHFQLLLMSDKELTDFLTKFTNNKVSQIKAILTIINQEKAYLKNNHFDDIEILIALNVTPKQLPDFKNQLTNSMERILDCLQRFPVEKKNVWEKPIIEFLPDNWQMSLRYQCAKLISEILEPNFSVDETKTKTLCETAAAQIPEVFITVNKDQVVVKKGSIITNENLKIIKAISGETLKFWPYLFVISLTTFATFLFCGLYIITFEPKLINQKSSIGLILTMVVLTMAIAGFMSHKLYEFIPLPALSLILTIFFGRNLASIITLPLIILLFCGQILEPGVLTSLGLASYAAIIFYNKQNRNSLAVTGLIIGLVQGLTFILFLALTESIFSIHYLFSEFLANFFGGLISSILAVGSLPFLEHLFGLLTPDRLAQLVESDQPLLRKLEELAPGTYQHSLAVANLAEAGAAAIDGDVNLARAGALYHDIGKMVKAEYFIENQLGSANPHDSLEPEQSREKVLAHVTDGVKLAIKYRIPKAVQDFIPMHQGTSLMAYFYHKACLRDGIAKIDANFYRYPGPKPNTKETAIVMMADVSEAATHSLKNPTEAEVKEVISEVFKNRLEDGQFTDSSLSLEELTKIENAFVRVWRTLHHDRLKYPSTSTGKMAIYKTNNNS